MSYLQFAVTDHGRGQGAFGCASETRVLHLEARLSVAEIARLARAFAHNGVTRVRLTGGEPLLREEVVAIVETFARQPGIGVVAMTTDGVRLSRYAEPLLWAGLQRITVTLDSLDRDTYRALTGQDALSLVLEGLEKAQQLPFQEVGVSTVVRRGCNEEELPAFVGLARRLRVSMRFTELPRQGGRGEWEAQFVPAAETRARLAQLGLQVAAGKSPRTPLPGGGSIEVAAPVSEPSPTQWRHLRVSADGRLTACEWQTEEEDLRPWLGAPDLDDRVGEAMERTTLQAPR